MKSKTSARSVVAKAAIPGVGFGPSRRRELLARVQGAAVIAAASRSIARGSCSGWSAGGRDLVVQSASRLAEWIRVSRGSSLAVADPTVTARPRAAGGILLGKLNTPDVTLGSRSFRPFGTAVNVLHGVTRNPCDPTGSIVAAGRGGGGIGSDRGGSIRNRAHGHGIVGFKQTSGRVPMKGYLVGYSGRVKGRFGTRPPSPGRVFDGPSVPVPRLPQNDVIQRRRHRPQLFDVSRFQHFLS